MSIAHLVGKGVKAMAMTKERAEATSVVYDLQGTLLEACSCGVLCPCWVGEDPDGGACDAFIAYHFDAGTIRGVDIGGLSLVNVVKIPGNVLTPASWKIVMFVDERATDEQQQALTDAYSGKLGGPLAWKGTRQGFTFWGTNLLAVNVAPCGSAIPCRPRWRPSQGRTARPPRFGTASSQRSRAPRPTCRRLHTTR